jgi:DNA processing protein
LDYLGVQNLKEEKEIDDVLLDETERAVWQALSHEPIYLDDLSEKIRQPTSSILNVLLMLEIKGFVKQLPGMSFVKKYNK